MDAVETTAVVSAIVAVLGSIVIPLWLNRRKNRNDNEMAGVVSWKGITAALQIERDSLREQLDGRDERHRRQIEEMEVDWERRATAMKKQITDLTDEVAALRRALASPR